MGPQAGVWCDDRDRIENRDPPTLAGFAHVEAVARSGCGLRCGPMIVTFETTEVDYALREIRRDGTPKTITLSPK